ncbi:hypothetical protein SAMN02745170_03400 [Propionispora hippei DSM 15287]|uniref:Uncharacterized protein n=2 Tax=Propionispora TaxID=112902 RepID=A0A1M6ME14_9FIRM|nr:hypothetical protein SAMN02745170_03400 [Propionispora hippei DSM 15287]
MLLSFTFFSCIVYAQENKKADTTITNDPISLFFRGLGAYGLPENTPNPKDPIPSKTSNLPYPVNSLSTSKTENSITFIALLIIFYLIIYRPIKKLVIPFLKKVIPKGIKYIDVLYFIILLICLLFVPYKDIKGHTFTFIINNRVGNMDYFFLFYEILVISVIYALIKIIIIKTLNSKS